MKKLTSIFIGLLYCIVRLYALPDIEGCDVGITFENSTLREFSLNQFTRNVPKSNEILRTKIWENFVIIHGTQLAVICETSVDFSESDFKILIGYAGNKEKQKFFYDCPMRKI
uniref:Sema domain-containing protein n=1 Tax=Megaselia scalaris TaxID=36166 RepID=T1GN51_MEGSC